MSNLDTDPFEVTQELKRCISRLSFIGMGLSDELDAALSQLRNAIKKDESVESIKAKVDKISKILQTLEESPVSSELSKIPLAASEIDFLSIMLDQKFPKPLKKQLRRLKANSQQAEAAETAMSIAKVIQSFIDELQSTARQPSLNPSQHDNLNETVNESKKPGFFANLFNKKEAIETELSEIETNQQASHPNLPVELKIALKNLICQLASLENYRHIANRLVERTDEMTEINELEGVLEAITSTFVEVSEKEHQQFENFLKALNRRIDKVNNFINHTVNYSLSVKNESGNLDKELKESVSLIKTSVEGSNSLAEVKSSIYQKIDAILKKVNRFYQGQEENYQKLNQDVDKLQQQLKQTEEESNRLKEDLEAQKLRAQTDNLTKLPNRYSYNEYLTQEYNRWRRYRSPLSLAIGDIDFFKKINDTYGHAVGDEVLKELANHIQKELRESDFVARFGGEEFVILLPETTLVAATKAINKLRLSVKNISIKTESDMIQFAMSFGIAEFEDDDTPKTVFERADKALYRAKRKGRDQVCCQRINKNKAD